MDSRRIVIKVTAEDIEKGDLDSPRRCPVARAVKRAFRCRWTKVCMFQIFTSRYETWRQPKRVQSFVDRFDRRRPVKPFSFTLRLLAAPGREGGSGEE